MNRRCLLLTLIPAFLVAFSATPAPAEYPERVVELWRSRYGEIGSGTVNPTDGSVWLIEGPTVTHIAADGTLIFRSQPFSPADGSAFFTSILTGLDSGFFLSLGGLAAGFAFDDFGVAESDSR